MLKKQNSQPSERKKSELQNSPGQVVRDNIIKAAEEAVYAAGNKTEALVKVAEKIGGTVDGVTALVGGTESAFAMGRISFKTTQDVARGDTVCTGLCLVSGTC